MIELLNLADRDMQEIAAALRSGRLSPPFSAISVQRILPGPMPSALVESLKRAGEQGFSAEQTAAMLELLRADRQRRPRLEDIVQVVATGPEMVGSDCRDTSVVVRDLFASATHSILVAGYAVYQGQRVFQALADRMRDLPALQVRLFLDVHRGHGDTTLAAELVRRFSERFVRTQWPADRPLPKVYYDPRSLDLDQTHRTSLHAECVVVDGRDVFVSSANFTEAAQHRNIELGLLLKSEAIAAAITNFFETRLANHLLQQLL